MAWESWVCFALKVVRSDTAKFLTFSTPKGGVQRAHWRRKFTRSKNIVRSAEEASARRHHFSRGGAERGARAVFVNSEPESGGASWAPRTTTRVAPLRVNRSGSPPLEHTSFHILL